MKIRKIEFWKSMNQWRSLHGFIEYMVEFMELPCPKLRRSSRRRGKARRQSKIFGEEIKEPHRRTYRRSFEEPDETGSSIDEEPRNFWVLPRSKNPEVFRFFVDRRT
ncbi:hypothetical protein ACOSQ2_010113 [Xanthoceras sorbifolium]